MHKLDFKKTMWPVVLAVAILYLVCGIAYLIAPVATISFFSGIFHAVKLEQMPLTFGGLLLGLVQILIWTVIFTAVFIWLWNYFNKE